MAVIGKQLSAKTSGAFWLIPVKQRILADNDSSCDLEGIVATKQVSLLNK